ncbi:MAG: hypothetical protein ACE5EG_05510 [Thermoanaerobaculia bacterium]
MRTVLCSCAVMLLLNACSGGSPEEKVARLRGMYSARLNGFLVQQPPAAEPEMLDEEGAEPMEAEVEPMEGEGEMVEPMEMLPANPNIMLDILIQHDSPEILPGITVDISMADGAGNEKGSWRVWFDTSKMKKANVTQYTHVLEDVPYEEGDGFFAEVRHPVPVEERGEYSEFSSAG